MVSWLEDFLLVTGVVCVAVAVALLLDFRWMILVLGLMFISAVLFRRRT